MQTRGISSSFYFSFSYFFFHSLQQTRYHGRGTGEMAEKERRLEEPSCLEERARRGGDGDDEDWAVGDARSSSGVGG